MSAKPAPTGYSATQIRLHWAIFLLIAFQLIFGESIADAWRAIRRGEEPGFDPLVAAHVFVGIAILLLVVWRVVVRLRRGAPRPPEHEPAPLKIAATVTHLALYALMLLMPISGLAAWFGGVEAAGDAHETMKPIIIILVLLHIGGALYQRFILKTDVMTRMVRPQ